MQKNWLLNDKCWLSQMHRQVNQMASSFTLSVEVAKEERPELQKKTYKWNTKEEAKQAFKELLKEKVFSFPSRPKMFLKT